MFGALLENKTFVVVIVLNNFLFKF